MSTGIFAKQFKIYKASFYYLSRCLQKKSRVEIKEFDNGYVY